MSFQQMMREPAAAAVNVVENEDIESMREQVWKYLLLTDPIMHAFCFFLQAKSKAIEGAHCFPQRCRIVCGHHLFPRPSYSVEPRIGRQVMKNDDSHGLLTATALRVFWQAAAACKSLGMELNASRITLRARALLSTSYRYSKVLGCIWYSIP